MAINLPSASGDDAATTRPIVRIGVELEVSDAVATVSRDRVVFAGSTPKQGTHWRIVSGNGNPGVVMLPVRRNAETNELEIGLVHVFRYPLGASSWEIPRGRATSPDWRAEAARELREETRAEDVEISALGTIHPDSGIMETRVVLCLARLRPGCPFQAAGEEQIDRVTWKPLPEVTAMVLAGEITDGFTISALWFAQARGLLG